jgi:hypothetical protein
MTTRQTIPLIEGKEQIQTGYDTTGNDPSSFYIPSCGLEDVDQSIVDLFDEEIKFRPYYQQITSGFQKEINLKKPFVIFASGERFALAKRLKPFRDRNGVLLLPGISIRRTKVEQQNGDLYFGEMTIKKRFDPSDVDYQQLINRQALSNAPGLPGTLRDKGFDKNVQSIREGMRLDFEAEDLRNQHIYEFITIPFPQAITVSYEIVFWTNYAQHMNYMLETMLSSQVAPGKNFYLKTKKGYWFTAIVNPELSAQDNGGDDISDAERIIKYSFEISVRGFILAPQGPGQRVPFKRYLSAVNMSFETVIDSEPGIIQNQDDVENYKETKNEPTDDNHYILSDINQDVKTAEKQPEQQKLLFQRQYKDYKGDTKTKTIRQTESNQKRGETVYSASDIETIMTFFTERK